MHIEKEGFKGTYYPAKNNTDKAFIAIFGDTDNNLLTKGTAKWINSIGYNALGIGSIQNSEDSKGYHNFPLEYIEAAVKWLFQQGNTKVGIVGGSTTGMVSLVAASYIPDISLVIAGTPCDFVMQGFYKGKKNGMKEWPAESQAAVSYRGESLQYQPYYLDEYEYWTTLQLASKKYKEINALDIFRHSENTKAIPEEAYIKVENIKGDIILFAAEDDTLWDAAKYCRRMENRLKEKNFTFNVVCHIYKIGTHFVFPDGIFKASLPVGSNLLSRIFASGRKYPKECKKTRMEIEKIVLRAIQNW